MSITSLLTAVRTRLLTLTYTPTLAGIWFGLAPDGTSGTYITYTVPDSQRGRGLGTASIARWEDTIVTFSIWTDGTSPAVCITIGDQLKTLFEASQPLGASVPLCIAAEMTGYAIIEDPDGGFGVTLDILFTMEDS